MAGDWVVSDSDRDLFRRELDSFVPARIFDVHAHLYDINQFTAEPPALLKSGPPSAGVNTFRSQMDLIHPGRTCDGLFFGFPHIAIDMDTANRFVASEAARSPASRAQMLIRPTMSADEVFTTVKRDRFSGLKCYHV